MDFDLYVYKSEADEKHLLIYKFIFLYETMITVDFN